MVFTDKSVVKIFCNSFSLNVNTSEKGINFNYSTENYDFNYSRVY